MRLVYLLRHGIAIDRTHPDCPRDSKRALTAKGHRRTVDAVRGLATMGVTATAMAASQYARAMETATIAQRGLGLSAEIQAWPDLEPSGAVAATARRLMASTDGPILVVGHAPHLDHVIATLTQARVRLKKAGAACVDLDDRRLVWLMEPRALRKLGTRSSNQESESNEAPV